MEQRRMDYHLHTLHSMDGRQTLEELCRTMVERGVEEICLTEHIEPGHPDPTLDVPPVWENVFSDVERMREKYPMLTIRTGVEIGDNKPIRNSIKKYLEDIPLDFRLLSLHLVNGIDPYEHRYFEGKTRDEAYREYAEAKAESILNWTEFDSVAHIGYVGKFSIYQGAERPLRWQEAPDALDAVLQHVISLGKCIEVNTSGYNGGEDPLPHTSIIRRYIELGGETFTFGSDSHDTLRNYADVERAKDLVRSLGGKYQAAFCRRKPTYYRI